MSYLIENPESSKQEIHNLIFGENTIGRELDNTIIVMYSSVSRYHAKLMAKALLQQGFGVLVTPSGY